MKISPCAGLVLLAFSTAAFAQRPPVYPLRSQTAATQSVDSAYCYWQARQQTGVDMTHLSQRPPRTKRAPFAPDAGKGTSEPPLPIGRNAPPDRANGASGAGARAVPGPGGAAAAKAGDGDSGAPPNAGRGGASPATEAPASAAVAAAGMSSATAASGGAAAAGAASAGLDATAPRLPPPPPPMTAYWQAYGDCMHERGYGVQ